MSRSKDGKGNESWRQQVRNLAAVWARSAYFVAGPPASDDALAEVRRRWPTFPEELLAIYAIYDGGAFVEGNIMLLPLRASDDFCLLRMTEDLIECGWIIPTTLVVFAGDGTGEHFGLWLPPTGARQLPVPVVTVGEIFEPGCMAITGTSVLPFLVARTAFYVQLEEGAAEDLALLGVPRHLWDAEPDEDLYRALFSWADPSHGDTIIDPYAAALDPIAVDRWIESHMG